MRTGNITQIRTHPSDKNGIQIRYEFPNGYGASVIRTCFSYGGLIGLFELAVMSDGELNYNTPITSDVIGYLSDEQVNDLLSDIENLPARTKIEKDFRRGKK